MLNRQTQVFVGCRDHPQVQRNGTFAPKFDQAALLQNSQQLGLQCNRQLPHLIKKNCAALGLLKQAAVVFDSASKSAFFVAKEHVFDHVLWQCSAVQPDKGAIGAGRRLVQHAGQHLFARAGWALDQHRHLSLRHPLGQGQQLDAHGINKHHAAHPALRRQAGTHRTRLVHAQRGRLNRARTNRLLRCAWSLRLGAIQRLAPGLGRPIICSKHMAGAMTHGCYRQLKVSALDPTNHRNPVLGTLQQLQGLNQQINVRAQPQNQQAALVAQLGYRCFQFFIGTDHGGRHACLAQQHLLGWLKRTKRI